MAHIILFSPFYIYALPSSLSLFSFISFVPASSNSKLTTTKLLAGHHNPPFPFSFQHQVPLIPPLHSPPSPPPFSPTNTIFLNLFHQENLKEPIFTKKLHHHLHHHLHHRSLHQAYHLHLLVDLFLTDYTFVPRNNVCKIPIWCGELDLHLHLLQTTTTPLHQLVRTSTLLWIGTEFLCVGRTLGE